MKISGIYKIINKTNGKYYIGSSSNILGGKGRWARHKTDLKYNRHDNEYLQRSWNKHGKDVFNFVVIEEIEKEKLMDTEQKYLDVAKNERDKCYNLSFTADRSVMEESTKKKISAALKGRVVGEETKRRLSNAMKGKQLSKSHRDSLRKSHLGKLRMPHTEETKLAMSLSHKGTNNYKYDFTLIKWRNDVTGETFDGTQNNFYATYGFSSSSVNMVVRGKRKSLYGWKIVG